MKNSPLVSIIMNCHNGEYFLKDSINSIINQSYKNWELIFWDNKSTDNSKKHIKFYNDKRIKYYYSNRYNTLYKSRNLAIKKAKGKFISFLDTDDMWNKEKLRQQINFVQKKNLNICYTNYLLLDENKNKKSKFIKTKKGEVSTQKLLDHYDLGILTTLVDSRIFKKFSFNTNYEIIGDFDFFINLSINYKI